MPTAGSNKSRYKIPDDLAPSGVCCITVPVPDDPEWVAMFMGAIWRLSLQTHYEREPTQSGKVAAAVWRGIWEDIQVNSCCGQSATILTINNTINVQNAQYMYAINLAFIAASLDIQVLWPETPADYDTEPTDTGDEVPRRHRALCIAVDSMVNTFCNRGLLWMESQTEEVAGLIAAGVALPFVPWYGVLGAIAGIGLLAGYVAAQLAEPSYRDYLTCGIFDALLGESTGSMSAFFQSADNLPARPPPPQTAPESLARDIIEIWIRSQLNNTENYLAFIDTLNTAFTVAISLADEDCGCIELCDNYTDGFELGLGDNTYLWPDPAIPVASRAGRDDGEWRLDAGEGFEDGGIYGLPTGTYVPPQEHVNATVFIELPDTCTVTSVTFRAIFHNGGPNRAHGLAFYDAAGVLVSTIYDELYTAPSAWSFDGQGGLSVSGAKWCRIFIESRIDWDLWMKLDQIVVEFA